MKKICEQINYQINQSGISEIVLENMGSMWLQLEKELNFIPIIKILSNFKPRVCMITCHELNEKKEHEIVYHFDISGMIINLKLYIPDKRMLSITPYFKSADWAEREISEMYGIKLSNHPNPIKLFLDPSIKEEVLSSYLSLSKVMSNSVSKELWAKVSQAKRIFNESK